MRFKINLSDTDISYLSFYLFDIPDNTKIQDIHDFLCGKLHVSNSNMELFFNGHDLLESYSSITLDEEGVANQFLPAENAEDSPLGALKIEDRELTIFILDDTGVDENDFSTDEDGELYLVFEAQQNDLFQTPKKSSQEDDSVSPEEESKSYWRCTMM